MRRLALAIVLACALSGVAHAGEIHTTGSNDTDNKLNSVTDSSNDLGHRSLTELLSTC
jgi:hypothetical protein